MCPVLLDTLYVKIFSAALPRSVSTPGLLESEGRVPLEEMWLAPAAPTSRSPDTNSVESR